MAGRTRRGIKTTSPNGDPETGVLLASDAASVIDDFVAGMGNIDASPGKPTRLACKG
jgi:hypothetical protein